MVLTLIINAYVFGTLVPLVSILKDKELELHKGRMRLLEKFCEAHTEQITPAMREVCACACSLNVR
jgi:hypothetical protein